jgi:hypothetical protein
VAIKATTEFPESTGRDGAVDHAAKLQGPLPSVGRPLYASSNGDRWYLVRDSAGVAVVHVPNESSGGKVQRMEIGDFLCRDGNGPERQELVRLIGTLVEG